jgi:demethylmenaquinone methyltransferase/2-methoxy-6-polyprenyl-1,4-benzoquinol methylase
LLIEGNALRLPFSDQSFDIVTIAFGLRNLERVDIGLAEIFRVLKPGGCVAILEFSRPVIPGFRQLFAFYFNRILPRIGAIISGPQLLTPIFRSRSEIFPDQKGLAKLMTQVGFGSVRYHNLSAGIAALHLGERC